MGDEPVDARLRISWDTLVEVSSTTTVSSNTALSIGNVTPGSITTTSPAATLTDEATGITIEAEANVLPEGTVLKSVAITSGVEYNRALAALADIGSNFALYDITLEADGVPVQPNGTVKVTVPVPQGMEATDIAVYRINDDGTKTLIVSTVEGNNIVFETNHFSLYALVDKTSKATASTSAGTSTNSIADAVTPLAEALPTNGPAWLWALCAGLALALVASIVAGVTVNRRLRKIVTGGGQ